MKRNKLQTLLYVIETRKGYKAHVVLDGKKCLLIVKDINGNLFSNKDLNAGIDGNGVFIDRWTKISVETAKEYADRYYLTSAVAELIEE